MFMSSRWEPADPAYKHFAPRGAELLRPESRDLRATRRALTLACHTDLPNQITKPLHQQFIAIWTVGIFPMSNSAREIACVDVFQS